MSATVTTLDLVSMAEAADLLGLSRQRITQLVDEGHVPPPVGRMRRGVVWTREQVEEWAARLEERNGHTTGVS